MPLHHLIYTELRGEIEEGRLAYGDILPSESELQKRYDVSRAPVRQALSRLESEQYVEKRQGKGTFVKYSLGRGPWYAVGGLGEDYRRDWDRQRSVTVSVEMVGTPPYIKAKDVFRGESEVIHIQRLRYVDDIPIYYLNQYLSPHFGIERIRAEGDFLTIRELLHKLFGIAVYQIQEEVAAVLAPEYVTKALRVDPGKPLLEISATAVTRDFEVAYCDLDYVNSNYWKYRSQRQEVKK